MPRVAAASLKAWCLDKVTSAGEGSFSSEQESPDAASASHHICRDVLS